MIAHLQKPDFVFRRNGRVHFNQRGASVQSTTGSRYVRISGSNPGYTMFRASVKSTGCPLHSPVSPLLPLPCVTVRHHISTGLFQAVTAVGVWYSSVLQSSAVTSDDLWSRLYALKKTSQAVLVLSNVRAPWLD